MGDKRWGSHNAVNVCIFLYRGITECYDIQLIGLHVSTTEIYLYYIKSDYMFRPFMWSSSGP